jgi:hypothetical protein
MKTIRFFAFLLALGLSACGGDSDPVACNSGNADVNAILNPDGCPESTPIAGVDLASLTLSLSLTDASGAAMTSVAPGQNGTLQAWVKDSKGSAVPNVAVTFTTSDKTGVFVPTSGTALTDASGVARVGLAAGTQAGAFTVTAGAAVGDKATSGAVGYSVAFPALSLSALDITPATLSAGGNASVSVTVSSGSAPYAPPLSVSFTSPCIAAGKAAIGSPVLTQSGVAAASYTDKGCGVADIITASVAFGGATVTKTGTINVLPAAAGSIKFVSADTTNIALKGTGGFGRQEFSTLKFEVSDITGNKVAGTLVDFKFSDSNTGTTVGGLTLNPSSASSAADGTVTTLVTAGTIPTSVRVVATVHGSAPLLTTLSNILVISTGVPDQKHFSLATEIGNCEGWNVDNDCSYVTATVGDHFGNPAPDGTAVNFTTEGGVIGASCVTGSLPPPGATPTGQTTNSKVGPGSGTCTVLLRASNPRPAGGRVTVLAYALGEENLLDANGNNVYDTGDTFTDKSPDIFRDDTENGTWTAGESCVGPNSNGTCSSDGDGQYNGVLRNPQVPSAQTLYVNAQLVQLFSGSDALVSFNPSALVCPAGGTANVQVTVKDVNGNIMPAGTSIDFSALIGAGYVHVLPASTEVPNVVLGVGQPLIVPSYTVTVACPLLEASSGQFMVTVTTPITKTITNASIPIN